MLRRVAPQFLPGFSSCFSTRPQGKPEDCAPPGFFSRGGELLCPNLNYFQRSEYFWSRERSAMSPERRKYPRFRAKGGATCALVSGLIPSFRARILDISQGGAKLLVTPPLIVGDLVRIRLSRVIEGELVHATPTPTGKWVVGCAFRQEISESEVRSLVRKSDR